MEPWVIPVIAALFGGGGVASVATVLATRKKDKSTDANERWDDASTLATQIKDYVDAEVAKAVAPLQSRIQALEADRSEMHAAVQTRETQLWLWNLRGRAGVMPMLPTPILHKLGLGHLVHDDDLNDTLEIEPLTKE